MRKPLITACILVLGGLAFAQPVQAQGRFGVQLDVADDYDIGIGVRGDFALGEALGYSGDDALAGLRGVASFDYYFWNCAVDCSYFEINGNVLYPLDAGGNITPYVGGGLNIARASVDIPAGGTASDTDVGLNILAGLNFPLGDVTAFTEVKGELGGGDQLALTLGILFGGGGGEE